MKEAFINATILDPSKNKEFIGDVIIEKDKIDLDNISYTKLEEIYPKSVKYAEEDENFYKEAKRVALELNKENTHYM